MRDTRFLRAAFLAAAVCLAAPAAAQQPKASVGAAVPAGSTDPGGGPLPAFEPPLLDLIYAPESARPSALGVAVKTERFRAGPDGWCVPVVLSVDAADLRPVPAAQGDAADAVEFQVDAVALVSDAGGRVVAKLSRSARFRASKRETAAAGADEIALICAPARRPLAPGSYTLQVCVCDPVSKRATVLKRTFTLPELPASSAPALSSLVLARYAEAAPAAGDPDPFVVAGTTRVVSNATGRFAKSHGDRMIAFYKLYGPPGVQYQARIEFLLAGKLVSSTPVDTLPPIGPSGEVGVAPVVPLDGFAPGAYRAVLQLFAPGSTTPVATSMTPFTVEP
jgi:hypothetical protein